MIQTIILSAGKGKRMNSTLPKVLHKAAYHPLLEYVITAAKDLGGDIYTVIGHKGEEVKAAFEGQCNFVYQKEQKGTGNAVKVALPALGDDEGTVLVLCGDSPLITGVTLQNLVYFHESENNDLTVITTKVENPFGYGRIIRNPDGTLNRIVEEKDANETERAIQEINSGIYCFKKSFLNKALNSIKNDNAQGEFYLTDTVGYGSKNNSKMSGYAIDDYREILGVNNPVQLSQVAQILFERKNTKLMAAGVTIISPVTTFIDKDVTIGSGTVIEPNTIICGKSSFGENCHIGPNSEVNNSTFGNNVHFWHSIANEAHGEDNLNIGPFAYLRPEVDLKDHVKIGGFVEVKKSLVDEGTKIPHLSYVGDSIIGKNCNIGCGAITCNYDGRHKYQTTIGDNSFIGSNATLVAPVNIKEHVYIAAGSTITDDVPDDSLAIARERQTNKEGWTAKKFGKPDNNNNE